MSKKLNIIQAMEMSVGTEFRVVDFYEKNKIVKILKNESDSSCKKYLVWGGSEDFQVNVTETTMAAKFIPIQKPVSFMEVVKSNKRCKVEL